MRLAPSSSASPDRTVPTIGLRVGARLVGAVRAGRLGVPAVASSRHRAVLRALRVSRLHGPRDLSSRASGETPEVSGEPKLVENCLVVLARVRLPVGREPIVPPSLCELAQLRNRERRSRLSRTEPAVDVLF